jgi:NADH dehydrogenase
MENLEEQPKRKHIVVVGGGFAGLKFAQKLLKNNYYDVTLLDRNNYNYFTPLLYQVATGFLDPAAISYPFRMLFRKTKIKFRMAELKSVDTDRQLLKLNNGELAYDYLVFAAGTKTKFFGNPDMMEKVISLKGIDDAIDMRNVLIRTMEDATLEPDPVKRQKLLTTVIVGGGATGVEVAGVLAEMKKHILLKEYPELENTDGVIYVVDGHDSLLAPMSEKSHKEAYKILTRLGVEIKLNTVFSNYEDDKVTFSDGQSIDATTVIWCAGVTANLFDGIPKSSLGSGNRMMTDAFNKVVGLENVYAIGDICLLETDVVYPKGHPQLAQPAIQQGKHLANNFLALAKGKAPKPFKYFDRGDMAIIGRNYAVADLLKHKLHLSGFIGLISWLFIHVVSLVNYNNKIKTIYGWIVAYLTNDQHLRMIFKESVKQPKTDKS